MELGAMDKVFGEKSWPGRVGGYQEGLKDGAAQGNMVRGGEGRCSRAMFSASKSCEITEMRLKHLKSG